MNSYRTYKRDRRIDRAICETLEQRVFLSATQTVITGQPTDAVAGASQAFVVSLEDAGGNVDAADNAEVTLAIASGPGGAPLGGILTATAVNGVATFSGITFTAAGTYTLSASSSGLASGASAPTAVTLPPVDVWSGAGDGSSWFDANNWQGNAVPASGDSVDFPANTPGAFQSVVLTSPLTIFSISVEGSYDFTGGTMTVGGDITTSNADDEIGNAIFLTHVTTVTVAPSDQLILGAIIDGGNNDGILIQGGGLVVFASNGNFPYTGPTEVAAGTLELDLDASTSVTVDSGATLDGSATVGQITGNGGTISLSGANGTPSNLSSTGGVSLANSTLQEVISSSSGTGLLSVSGSILDLTNSTLALSALGGFTPPIGQVITVIANNTGALVNGTFSGLAQGAVSEIGGVFYQISYTGGTSNADVTLTVVPQPADVWTGATGNQLWSDGGNWQGGVAPASGQSVDFPANAGNQLVFVDADYTVGDITIEGFYDIFNHANPPTLTVNGNIASSSFSAAIELNIALTHNTTITVGPSGELVTNGITDGGNGFGIIDQGGGQLIVEGAVSYSGATEVAQGMLDLSVGPATNVTVDSAATLNFYNTGLVAGITDNGGAVLLNGSGSTGNLVLGTGSTLQDQLFGSGTFESADALTVTGATVDLTGSTLKVAPPFAMPPFSVTPTIGNVITLIFNQTGNAVTGTFNGLVEGAVTEIGTAFYQISYAGGPSGHDVTLTVVPRPVDDWTGGANNGLWSDPGNWQAGTAPGPDDDIVFPDVGGAPEVVDLTADETVSNVSLAGSYVLRSSSNTLTIDGDVTAVGSNDDFLVNVALGHDTTITVGATSVAGFLSISDGGQGFQLTKAGQGTLFLKPGGTFAGLPGGAYFAAGGFRFQIVYTSVGAGNPGPVTGAPGVPAQLVVVQQPLRTAAAGQSIGTVVVGVEDAFGNIVASDDSDITISALPSGSVTSGQGGSVLIGKATVSAQSGIAVFSNLAITQGGAYRLNATDGLLAAADTAPLTISPATTLPPTTVVAGSRVTGLAVNPATAFPSASRVSKVIRFRVETVSGSPTGFSKTVRVRHGSATWSNLRIRKAGIYNVVISDSFGHSITEQLTVITAFRNH